MDLSSVKEADAGQSAIDWWAWTARQTPSLRTKTIVIARPTGSDVQPALSV